MNMSDSSEAHIDALDARLSSWHNHSFSYPAPTIPHSEPLIFALDDFEAGSPMGWESTTEDHHSQHTSSSFLGDVPTIRRPYMASSHASLPSEWLNNTLGSGDTVHFEPCATGPGFALKTEEPSFSWSHWPDRGAFSSSEDLTTSPSADSVTLPSESGSSQPTDIRAMPRMLSYDSEMFGGGSAPAHDRSFGFGQEFGVHPSAISLPSSPWSNHFPKERPTLPLNPLFAPQAVRPATFLQQQPLLRSGGPQLSPSPVHFVNQTAQYSTASPSARASASASESKLRDKSQPVVTESRLRKRKRPEVMEDDVVNKDDADMDAKDKVPIKSELHPPKQAPSTWQVFFTDWLQQHRSRKPADKLNVAQAAKEAGAIYKSLSGEEKEGLKRRAALAKERRERSLAAWQRTLTPEDIKRENRFRAAQRKAGKSRKGNIKDPNAPKKPLSAYFMFLAKIRSSPELVREVFGDEQETTKQSVLAARKWREMSEAQKKPFLSQAEQDKIAYEAARKIYEGHTTGYMHGSSHGAFPSTGAILMTSFTTDAGTENDGDSEGPPDMSEEDDTWEDA